MKTLEIVVIVAAVGIAVGILVELTILISPHVPALVLFTVITLASAWAVRDAMSLPKN